MRSCVVYFLSHLFFLSRDLCVAAEREVLSLADLAFSCRGGKKKVKTEALILVLQKFILQKEE